MILVTLQKETRIIDKQIEVFIARNGGKRRDENVCTRNNNIILLMMLRKNFSTSQLSVYKI
jgi:hypothetical protein